MQIQYFSNEEIMVSMRRITYRKITQLHNFPLTTDAGAAGKKKTVETLKSLFISHF